MPIGEGRQYVQVNFHDRWRTPSVTRYGVPIAEVQLSINGTGHESVGTVLHSAR